ncbi:hypothetical protein [Legionella waltersii]|uniref:Uncharacterized protein n=1 Tax=Legionella waltersii TaxID=66969 RepID=A0A0W1AAH2_9GAMM|nr:hypothetical protein [Legionella waltersii]KTD78357.1 hypothetical protein Lwal_1792 [Legionella waltersii]SNV06477.1 Uncharacterised protein [Legionella waltersii]
MLCKFFKQTTRLTFETAAIAGIAYGASTLFGSIPPRGLSDEKQPVNKDGHPKTPKAPSIIPF